MSTRGAAKIPVFAFFFWTPECDNRRLFLPRSGSSQWQRPCRLRRLKSAARPVQELALILASERKLPAQGARRMAQADSRSERKLPVADGRAVLRRLKSAARPVQELAFVLASERKLPAQGARRMAQADSRPERKLPVAAALPPPGADAPGSPSARIGVCSCPGAEAPCARRTAHGATRFSPAAFRSSERFAGHGSRPGVRLPFISRSARVKDSSARPGTPLGGPMATASEKGEGNESRLS